ncbi:MAG TPA: ABC transporter ATP-binding protein [Bacteroidales bacterium]|nr:ABC transporter ATP-binding protein [Bacteroidales bacterium]
MADLIKILHLVVPFWKRAMLSILANFLAAVFAVASLSMVIPFLRVLFRMEQQTSEMPDAGLSRESISAWFNVYFNDFIRQTGEQQALLLLCLTVIILFLFKNLFQYLGMYFLAPLRTGVIRDLRNKVYGHMLILPISYYTERKKGDLMARSTTDMQEVEWSIMRGFELFFREPVSLLFFLLSLIILSPRLSLFVFILLPLAGLLIGSIARSLRRKSVKSQRMMGEILSVIEESLGGLRIIKAFNAIPFSLLRFRKLNQAYTRLMISLTRRGDLSSPLSEVLGITILVFVLWYGGSMVLNETVSLGPETFIAYLVIFSQMLTPAKSLTTAYYQVQKGMASLARIEEVLQAEERIIETSNAVSVNDLNSEITFTNVGFAHADSPVLKNINLKIRKGQVIAIVGPSGAGKSTLADMLPRFHDPDEGSIMLDGEDLRNLRIDKLRALMGIVSQDTILFNDTVLNNIAFGAGDFTEDQVRKAAQVANAEEFILQMEHGYHTMLGDRGARLSGGQRQRISIARAVLRNPPILILDEATSSLDTASEKLVQEAIEKLMEARTVVIIAHRLSTIRKADLVVVMDQGEIRESGSHEELIQLRGVYYRLYMAQAGNTTNIAPGSEIPN